MTRIRQYEQTAGQWASQNPVLLKGELVWESGPDAKAKKGDGVTAYNDLPYAIEPGAPLNSPAFTGNPTAPTPLASDDDTSIATTGFVKDQEYAPLASPIFTGDPKAPTPSTSDNDTSVATTAFVKAQSYAPLASPVFTGNPTAPTPATGDDDTSVATTAFVKAALLAVHPIGDIKMTAVNTNPGTYLGGTWVAWGSGRVPVGVDASQTEFDAVEKVGGAKTVTLTTAEMPAHNHGGATGDSGAIPAGNSPTSSPTSTPGTFYALRGLSTDSDLGVLSQSGHTHPISSQGGGGAHNNLQPYITCYMWKRTA